MHSMGSEPAQTFLDWFVVLPWIWYSFVSPLETKGKQRKTVESTSPKPKETEGNQRIPKEN